MKDFRKDRFETYAIIAYFLFVIALGFYLASYASAGGTVEDDKVLIGGDCYAFTDYPTSQNGRRILQERGWHPMPLDKKLIIGELVRKKRAETLLIQEKVICGPFLGDMKVYHMWYWRAI